MAKPLGDVIGRVYGLARARQRIFGQAMESALGKAKSKVCVKAFLTLIWHDKGEHELAEAAWRAGFGFGGSAFDLADALAGGGTHY